MPDQRRRSSHSSSETRSWIESTTVGTQIFAVDEETADKVFPDVYERWWKQQPGAIPRGDDGELVVVPPEEVLRLADVASRIVEQQSLLEPARKQRASVAFAARCIEHPTAVRQAGS